MSGPAHQDAHPRAPASMGRRLGARVIDSLLLLIPIGIATGFFIAFVVGSIDCRTENSGEPPCTGDVGLLVGAGLLFFAGVTVAVLAYEVLCTGLAGATVGKRLVGVRVQDLVSGAPIGIGRAFVRQLVLAVTGSFLFLGYVSPLFDQTHRNRGWHDMAAGDIVVRR